MSATRSRNSCPWKPIRNIAAPKRLGAFSSGVGPSEHSRPRKACKAVQFNTFITLLPAPGDLSHSKHPQAYGRAVEGCDGGTRQRALGAAQEMRAAALANRKPMKMQFAPPGSERKRCRKRGRPASRTRRWRPRKKRRASARRRSSSSSRGLSVRRARPRTPPRSGSPH